MTLTDRPLWTADSMWQQAKDREERRWQQDAEGKVAQEDQWAKDREKGLKVGLKNRDRLFPSLLVACLAWAESLTIALVRRGATSPWCPTTPSHCYTTTAWTGTA